MFMSSSVCSIKGDSGFCQRRSVNLRSKARVFFPPFKNMAVVPKEKKKIDKLPIQKKCCYRKHAMTA